MTKVVLGIPFSSWIAGFQRSPRQPSSRPPVGLAGDPLFELECRIPARKADPQDNLHHGPLFRRDWPGIRFSSWNAGFQLEKRIPKTTFITAPFQEGPAGDPLFELECRIPARNADPQDNLHHGPLFRRDWPGIRFSSWNAGFQLEKRIPKTTFITAPFQEGLAGDPLFELECRIPARKADPQDNLHHGPLSGGTGRGSAFELECRIPARKADPQDNLHHGPLFRRDWPGIRFSSWNAGFQLEKRIPKTTFITAPFQEGLAGDPLFELECRIPARKADPQDNLHHGPLFRRDWPGIRFSSWNARFQLEKRIPKTTFITAPFSGGIGRGSAFRAGMPDSSSKSGSPRQPSSSAPFQEGLAGDPLFELECRIPARKADPQD